MSFLRNLFGKSEPATPVAQTPVECSHVSLVARWDSVEDMGKEDRATSFACEACGASFTPEEARKRRGAASGEDLFRRPVS